MFSIKEISPGNKGVFADRHITPDEMIGVYVSTSRFNCCRMVEHDKMTEDWFESNILGRWCNHSDHPNTKIIANDAEIVISSKGIQKGEEITVNYWKATKHIKFPKQNLGIYKKGLREPKK